MATAKKKQELEVVEDAPLSLDIAPDWMKKGSKGKELIRQEHVELPQLKIITDQTKGQKENRWQPGNFLHSILEEEVNGEEGILLTPILFLQPRYRLMNPIDQGGGVLARADDGINWNPANHTFDVKIHDGKKAVQWRTGKTIFSKPEPGFKNPTEWGSSDPDDPNSVPAADLQYRYLWNSPSHPHLGVFTTLMQRSALQAAERLNAFLNASEYDTFNLVFKVTTLWDDKGPSNKKFLWKIKPNGTVSTQEQSQRNEALYEQFKDADLQIHGEEENFAEETRKGPVIDGETVDEDGEY